MRMELKPLPAAAIPAALAKAERYRLLNEPFEAESICLDILGTDPNHDGALITLILALSDQFSQSGAGGVKEAQALLPRLQSEYERAYYAGIICERWAKTQLGLMPLPIVHRWLRDALAHFERAASLAPAENAEAVLRWNSTARLVNQNPDVKDEPGDEPVVGGDGWNGPPGK